MADVGRYWNTIRHLKPIQVYGRVWFRIVRPRVDLSPAPPSRPLDGTWVSVAERPASMLGPQQFRFLNDRRDLDKHGWDDPGLDKLWRYHLHYFDDLNAHDAAVRVDWHRALLKLWVRENLPAIGTAWEPYPTSLRIVNWIKWALQGNVLPQECAQSLAVQTRWLSRRVEAHLLGNHLFVNGKALVFAGLYFDGPEAERWMRRGLRILSAQVPEQILGDGGQFERSTMYHALALEDMLDLCNVWRAYPTAIGSRWQPTLAACGKVVGRMRAWLTAMTHPDGEIGLFNDAAMGIAPSPAALEQYASRLGLPPQYGTSRPLTELGESGYIRVEHGPAVAMLDVGPVGPDYLPGHAHADTLSFELSVFGQRVLVNSGTSRYGADAERLRQRGTAAHNTVVIDGNDSSDVWSAFRVARRARPSGLEVFCNEGIIVRCAHDGYQRLPGRPKHARQWSFNASALVVSDTLSGGVRHAQARFHLHPAIAVREIRSDDQGGVAHLVLPEGRRIGFSVQGGRLRQQRTTWHPEFGVTEPNVCLAVDFAGLALRTELRWHVAP
ncbi:MAG: alginate lyase family protein [Gemmatimonadales bacterium]